MFWFDISGDDCHDPAGGIPTELDILWEHLHGSLLFPRQISSFTPILYIFICVKKTEVWLDIAFRCLFSFWSCSFLVSCSLDLWKAAVFSSSQMLTCPSWSAPSVWNTGHLNLTSVQWSLNKRWFDLPLLRDASSIWTGGLKSSRDDQAKRNVVFSRGETIPISKNDRGIFSACRNHLFNRKAHSTVFRTDYF